jgi:hypothetical protein
MTGQPEIPMQVIRKVEELPKEVREAAINQAAGICEPTSWRIPVVSSFIEGERKKDAESKITGFLTKEGYLPIAAADVVNQVRPEDRAKYKAAILEEPIHGLVNKGCDLARERLSNVHKR